MDKGSNCEIPCSVSSHNKTQEWPNSVIMKWRDEDSCSTASSKDIRPSSLVEIVVYVVDVTGIKTNESDKHIKYASTRFTRWLVLCSIVVYRCLKDGFNVYIYFDHNIYNIRDI